MTERELCVKPSIMRTLIALLALLPTVLRAQPTTSLGPDAPDLSMGFIWDSGFTFALSNTPASNNYNEMYVEQIIPAESSPDPYWRFQGYAVMQFASPADADDSLAWVVQDVVRARPVRITDLSDGVSEMDMVVDPSGPADCIPVTWVLLNSGIDFTLEAALDVFTGQPYDPYTEYCFTALALGYNPYHIDTDCNEPQQVIMSSRSASGALVAHCVTGAAVGVNELSAVALQIGPLPADESLRLSGIAEAGSRIRVMDAAGAIVHEGSVRDGDALSVADWTEGFYVLQLTTADVGQVSRRFVVAHR